MKKASDISILTARELEVLSLVAQGHSAKEVAAVLFLSKRTVDFHLGNIYKRWNVHNAIGAINEAKRRGVSLAVRA